MHDRTATPKPLVGALPELKGYGRDLRIDACRGIALWCIFLDHVPNNIGSWLTLRNYGFSDAAEVFMFVSGVTCALAYGKARRCEGWTGSDQPDAAAKLGHLCRISAAHARLRHHGSPRRRRPSCRREQYAHSVGTAGRDARARGDPAIPPRQHRRLAALRALSPFVRAAAVAAAASAERNARRVAVALRTGARLRLDHPGMAEQPLVLQSAGLAAAVCAWRVVDHRGQEIPAVGDLTHRACGCRSLSGVQPHHRIELEHQTAGSSGPAGAADAALPDGQIRISIHCDCCIFWPLRFWWYGSCLAIGEG